MAADTAFREMPMAKRSNAPDAGRRNFLKGATLAGAAALAPPVAASTQASDPPKGSTKAAVPGPRLAAAETMPPSKDPVSQTTSGGDFMVDVFKTLDIDYLAMNCASSFRGLHEAVLNHGGNTKPEILTCPHEEIAVHMAQGYAKIEGKPMATDLPRRGRSAACNDGDVQCLVRSRSSHRHGWQHHRGQQARAGRRMGAFGNRPGRNRARLRKVG